MPKHIFIIEDDLGIQDVMEMLFLDEGFRVSVAIDSNAIARILEEVPDLVFVDIHLNGSVKNGYEICHELKGHYRTQEIPLLLISAETNLAQLAEGCKANGHVTKPFDITQLVERAHDMLG